MKRLKSQIKLKWITKNWVFLRWIDKIRTKIDIKLTHKSSSLGDSRAKKMLSRQQQRVIRLGSFFAFICIIFYYLGLTTRLFEESFDKSFSYPFNGDVFEQCFLIRHNSPPEIPPINNQTFSLRHNNEGTCLGEIFLTIVVKSAINHFGRRDAIRNSWGVDKEFNAVQIRTIFTLGIDKNTHDGRKSSNQKLVDHEAEEFNDIIQVRIARCFNK